MTTIIKLNSVDSVNDGDLLPIYSTPNSDTRKASLSVLSAYFQSKLAAGKAQTQYAAPSANGFSIIVQPAVNGADVHVLITPTSALSGGVITLPDSNSAIDKQSILITTTFGLSGLTFIASGSLINGSTSIIAENNAVEFTYDKLTNSWYSARNTLDSADTSFIQFGTGAVARTVQAELRETFKVTQYSTCNGLVDDTANIQALIDYVAGLGGGAIEIPNNARVLIDSANLYVKSKVSLVGPRTSKTRVSNPTGNTAGGLIVNPAYTIQLAGDGAELSGVYVLRKNLYRPATIAEATTELANFTGTGITLRHISGGTNIADDCKVRDVFVAGFAQAIYGNYCGRYLFENVIGDNMAGIKTENVFDVGRKLNCHFWPFVTSGLGGTGSQNWRSGVGFEIAAANDWSQAQNCFCFGYTTGFKIGANSVRLIGCGVDGNSASQPAGSKAFHILSTAADCQLVACEAAAHEYLYYNESTNTTQLNGCAGWGSPVNHIYHAAGTLVIAGGNLYNTASNAAIAVAAGVNKLSVDGVVFNGVGAAYSINSASALKCDIAPNNIYIGTVTGLDADTHKHVETTAAVGHSWYSVGGAGGYQHKNYYATGSASTPAAVASGNTLGSYRFFGYDGSNFVQAGIMRCSAAAAPSAGVVPGSFTWSTMNSSGAFADRLVLQSSGDLAPATDNANSSGTATLRWTNVYAYNVNLKPPASVTPTNNGELMFQLTSNTQLTIKVKGSDGIVRSVNLTLA